MIMLPMQCHTKQVTKDRKYGASICYKEVENSKEITKSIPNFTKLSIEIKSFTEHFQPYASHLMSKRIFLQDICSNFSTVTHFLPCMFQAIGQLIIPSITSPQGEKTLFSFSDPFL